MTAQWLHILLEWVGQHPHWAGLLVFLVAFSESLALVGLFVPGVALMFGIGALVGSGHLALWPTLVEASLGALAGDGLSFWLGRHFHQQLKVIWPFRSHPKLVTRSTDFIHRHGGKSILFGRFVGPIRPVIPAVAGMLEMAPWRFFIVNLLSALLWAPAYLLPGMVFGASLGLAAEVAGRLALLLVILVGLLLALFWGIHKVFSFLHPHAYAILQRVLTWSQLHPRMGQLPAALVNPEHPESRELTLLGALLLFASLAFLMLLEASGGRGLLENLDSYVLNTLQALRNPWMDRAMVLLTGLGGVRVLGGLFVVLLGWLVWQQRWRDAAHWLGAVSFSLAAVVSLQRFVHPGLGAMTFPSAHVTQSMVMYGFLAVVVARELSAARRWLPYSLAGLLVGAIAFSRLYLSAQWLSDVLGGLTLGLVWVTLLGIAYMRHPSVRLPTRALNLTAASLLIGVTIGNASTQFQQDLAQYRPQRATRSIAVTQWWQGTAWEQLPRLRVDLRGRPSQPLTLQYAGDPQTLAQTLSGSGWYRPPALTASSWLHWLAGNQALAQLPVLPQVHEGHSEALLLVHPGRTPATLYALRLWPTAVRIGAQQLPLWVGSTTELHIDHVPLGLNVPRTGDSFSAPLRQLMTDINTLPHEIRQRGTGSADWDGTVLLVK